MTHRANVQALGPKLITEKLLLTPEEAAKLSDHLLKVREMTKEYASPGILKRVAEERHGHPMGTVRPPLVPVSPSFDVVAATALALSGPEG